MSAKSVVCTPSLWNENRDLTSMLFCKRVKDLAGGLLLCGPESKPFTGAKLPHQKNGGHGKFFYLTRWLEAADGGRFAGQEEKAGQDVLNKMGLHHCRMKVSALPRLVFFSFH